jgi:hypothetical protein
MLPPHLKTNKDLQSAVFVATGKVLLPVRMSASLLALRA